ncbi:MAG: cobalamin-binding protein [Gammaproteobacteria bacterium]|nr:cobalamin-binding protein [Gammaproteobacteria bacterium]
MPEIRIVSLIASATEIVAALGLQAYLVGRSHECDYPNSVLALPSCSSSKVDKDATSNEIDQQVRSMVRDALSIYQVDYVLLNELSPTHILTQTQCDVCAVTLDEVNRALAHLQSAPAVTALEPMTLTDIWCDIQSVADVGNVSKHGHALVERLKKRLVAIAEKTALRDATPTVACIEWIHPLMYAANWVPELITIAGGQTTQGQAGLHSGYFDFMDLVESDPDYILIMPCGFNVDRTLKELAPLTTKSLWQNLPAVRGNRVYLVDGNYFFNRPSPRVVESAEIAAEILHPQLCSFGHEDRAYKQLTHVQTAGGC